MRFVVNSTRSEGFVWFNIATNILSILVQWTCSAFVLTTVHNIQKRISNRTISSASAKRSQRQRVDYAAWRAGASAKLIRTITRDRPEAAVPPDHAPEMNLLRD
uniref:Uncharacterized protein n=1 Tax=Plectus sambesii TaxID=2011161 RepID=A0A914V720_9BILA